jgi:peptide/nickel transport system permease protein
MLASDLGYLAYQPSAPAYPIVLIMIAVWALNLLADVLRDTSGESGRILLKKRALATARRRGRRLQPPLAGRAE